MRTSIPPLPEVSPSDLSLQPNPAPTKTVKSEWTRRYTQTIMMGGWVGNWEAFSLSLFPSCSLVSLNLSTCLPFSPLLSCCRDNSSFKATACLSLALSLPVKQNSTQRNSASLKVCTSVWQPTVASVHEVFSLPVGDVI